MRTTTARRHVGTTVLANSENGHRDDRYFTRPVVLLSVDTLWTYEYRQRASEGERIRIFRAHPDVRPNKGKWDTGVTGWLALVSMGDHENPVTPEELLAAAVDLDATTFPDNAAKIRLPRNMKLTTLLPVTVHELPYTELRDALKARREHSDRLRAEQDKAREEAGRKTRATLSYLHKVTDLLGVDEPAIFPPTNAPTVPILRILERLARAEGVALPPRPEHLREM